MIDKFHDKIQYLCKIPLKTSVKLWGIEQVSAFTVKMTTSELGFYVALTDIEIDLFRAAGHKILLYFNTFIVSETVIVVC